MRPWLTARSMAASVALGGNRRPSPHLAGPYSCACTAPIHATSLAGVRGPGRVIRWLESLRTGIENVLTVRLVEECACYVLLNIPFGWLLRRTRGCYPSSRFPPTALFDTSVW